VHDTPPPPHGDEPQPPPHDDSPSPSPSPPSGSAAQPSQRVGSPSPLGNERPPSPPQDVGNDDPMDTSPPPQRESVAAPPGWFPVDLPTTYRAAVPFTSNELIIATLEPDAARMERILRMVDVEHKVLPEVHPSREGIFASIAYKMARISAAKAASKLSAERRKERFNNPPKGDRFSRRLNGVALPHRGHTIPVSLEQQNQALLRIPSQKAAGVVPVIRPKSAHTDGAHLELLQRLHQRSFSHDSPPVRPIDGDGDLDDARPEFTTCHCIHNVPHICRASP
jgi:hypothetical protein